MRRRDRPPMTTLELVISAVVVIAIVVTVVVFLFVYHDFPFRTS